MSIVPIERNSRNSQFSSIFSHKNLARATLTVLLAFLIVHMYIYAGGKKKNSIFYRFSIYRLYLGEIIDYTKASISHFNVLLSKEAFGRMKEQNEHDYSLVINRAKQPRK